MSRELDDRQRLEQRLTTQYQKAIWKPFMRAIRNYELLEPGDRITVCISGGKDSMLLGKLMQLLQRMHTIPFEVVYLSMDPGYHPNNRALLLQNAERLGLPLELFDTNVFRVANRQEKHPCYLCARMRRGHLYAKAKELGCNKIALGHHFNDVIETTLMAMLYGGQLQGMLPRLKSKNFPGMELIRPLYCVREADIIAWGEQEQMQFLQCACRFAQRAQEDQQLSRRKATKELIATLMQSDPNVEKMIFHSIHKVQLDSFVSYTTHGTEHSFLEALHALEADIRQELDEKEALKP